MCEYEEHVNTAWSFDYRPIQPTIMTSGSDERRVNIWHNSQNESLPDYFQSPGKCFLGQILLQRRQQATICVVWLQNLLLRHHRPMQETWRVLVAHACCELRCYFFFLVEGHFYTVDRGIYSLYSTLLPLKRFQMAMNLSSHPLYASARNLGKIESRRVEGIGSRKKDKEPEKDNL